MNLLQAILNAGPVPAFLIAGLIGMVAHYSKKRLRAEVDGSAIDYFLRDYPGHTTGALFAFGCAAAALLASGALESMSTWTAVGAGLTTGWTADSAINKGVSD